MSDSIFLDTNIIIYSYSITDTRKQNIARKLISSNYTYVSTQVLQELFNTVTRKFKYPYDAALRVFDECINNNNIFTNTPDTIRQAVSVASRFNYSFYDSLIISSAISAGCKTLYSEDLHDGHLIDGTLTIVNPFA